MTLRDFIHNQNDADNCMNIIGGKLYITEETVDRYLKEIHLEASKLQKENEELHEQKYTLELYEGFLQHKNLRREFSKYVLIKLTNENE